MDKNNVESINFVFAKPYMEGYYTYGINSIDNLSLIEKTELKRLLIESLECRDFTRLEYLMDRNFPFYYDRPNHKIREFKIINDSPSEKEIFEKFTKDFDDAKNENKKEDNKFYNDTFDEKSKFFKQNIFNYLPWRK